jgi:hypothetical protein
VSTYFITGFGSDPASALRFLAEPLRVQVAGPGDKVVVTSSKALGANGLAASGLSLWVCRAAAGSAPVPVGDGVTELAVPANAKQLFTLSAVITSLTAGSYDVGLCGRTSNANWTNNDVSSTTAIVTP